METADVKVTIRCRAFGGVLEQNECIVHPDGSVSVWQDVPGGHCHYTRVHSLSERDLGRVRAAAKKLHR